MSEQIGKCDAPKHQKNLMSKTGEKTSGSKYAPNQELERWVLKRSARVFQ